MHLLHTMALALYDLSLDDHQRLLISLQDKRERSALSDRKSKAEEVLGKAYEDLRHRILLVQTEKYITMLFQGIRPRSLLG